MHRSIKKLTTVVPTHSWKQVVYFAHSSRSRVRRWASELEDGNPRQHTARFKPPPGPWIRPCTVPEAARVASIDPATSAKKNCIPQMICGGVTQGQAAMSSRMSMSTPSRVFLMIPPCVYKSHIVYAEGFRLQRHVLQPNARLP